MCRPYRPDYSGIRHSQAYDMGYYVTPIQGLQFGLRLGNLNKFDSARLHQLVWHTRMLLIISPPAYYFLSFLFASNIISHYLKTTYG